MNWKRNLYRELVIDLGSSNLAVGSSRDREPLRVGARLRVPQRRSSGRRSNSPASTKDSLPREEVRPAMRHGYVADVDALDWLLEPLLRHARRQMFWLPVRTLTGLLTPSGLSDTARAQHRDVAVRHGLMNVRLLPVAQALARGVGLSSRDEGGRMLVDIGGGKICVAGWSLGGVVSSHWYEGGGQDLDAAIAAHVVRRFRLRIDEAEAERVKIALGSVHPFSSPRYLDTHGVQVRSGASDTAQLNDDELRDVLVDGCESLVRAIEQAFRTIPPELSGEIADAGVVLTGGGALLAGLPAYLQERTGLVFRLAHDPVNVALRGAHSLLQRPTETQQTGEDSGEVS